GSYDSAFGCTELPPSKGEPQVFVIGGGGSGIPVYRRLQRMGTPFVTGILHENDVDYEAAVHLANSVIAEKAFEEIEQGTIEKALDVMLSCKKVICPLTVFGKLNDANRLLREEAAAKGLLIENE
ncbi:MAG: ABC transporter ATP-binding protein, partial [Eubacteriales bacterium]|nr:ABC transporter ATP-binding protein [Eubacteriales bacterium]